MLRIILLTDTNIVILPGDSDIVISYSRVIKVGIEGNDGHMAAIKRTSKVRFFGNLDGADNRARKGFYLIL
jgi:hypothetical protein